MKKMRGLGLALMVAMVTQGPVTVALASDVTAIQNRLDLENKAGKFSGVALVTLDGKPEFSGAIGEVNPQSHKTVSAATPWRLASITKQITAVLVMQEVERGHLTLDLPIGSLLPAFNSKPSGSVTIRLLLQHTSGLPDPSETPLGSNGVPLFYSIDTANHAFCAGTPRAMPGDFHYNNCDFYVLADILQVTTGKSYADLVRDRIAKPLRLRTLHLYAPGETEAFSGTDLTGAKEPPYHMSSFEAAAGLSASAVDLVAFDMALMSGKLLNPESLKALWTGNPKLGYVALGVWSYTVKPSGCAVPLTLVERRGAVGDVNVLNLIWPERKASIVVFSNNGDTDWGQLWQDSGLMRDLTVAAWCR